MPFLNKNKEINHLIHYNICKNTKHHIISNKITNFQRMYSVKGLHINKNRKINQWFYRKIPINRKMPIKIK